MILKKVHNIPIYFGKIIILVGDLSSIRKQYKLKGNDNGYVDAFVWWQYDANGAIEYYAAFGSVDIKPHVIAHESVHVVNRIFQHRGIDLSLRNDEPQAYLTGWVFKTIYDFLEKK